MLDENARARARDELILLWLDDQDRGRVRDVAAYQRFFPGAEDLVAAELRRLEGALARGHAPAGDGSASGAPAPPRAWRLGRYAIERELGGGSQGTVYLAHDTNLARKVALKVLKPAWSGSSTWARRFEREAQALARLHHPGLATVHEHGSTLGLDYLAMPYFEGRTLAEELAERGGRPLDRHEAHRYVGLVEKAARALHVAHESGLVHRDLKPGNLMITPAGEPVVLDFGLALVGDETQDLTRTGDVLGTPGFMAPELLAGDRRRIDRRSDVYALAMTLRAALAPGGRTNRIGRGLRAVLATGSDPDPDRRYATAEAFADDLARVRRGLPVAVRPAGAARKALVWCRRAPAIAAFIVLVPLLLVAGLIGLDRKNDLIRAATRLLERRQADAASAAARARQRFTDHRRLDDLWRLRKLEEREAALWPPHPASLPALERWLAEAGELLARLPEHRAALLALRARGTANVPREPGWDAGMDRLLHYERVRDAAAAELANPELPAARREPIAQVHEEAEARLAFLEPEVASRPRFRHEQVEDQWLDEQLAELVARLEALERPTAHGATLLSVRRRLASARSLEHLTLRVPAAAWEEAVRALADPATDPRYGGLHLQPVLGLIPLGRDPVSQLWEFAHVLSGAVPVRDADGRLMITEDTAIVLVLIPGGVARLGAAPPRHPGAPGRDHVDPAALSPERPVHDVELAPFLIAKHEMTQGQWLRVTGKNPSHHRPGRDFERGYRPDLRHPVEQVSYEDCEEALGRVGLVLPTEAQWELAARAGTTTPWWMGASLAGLPSFENLADASFAARGGTNLPCDLDRDDGWSGPAPVGTYPANPFGLHDVLGNVAEWCRDRIEFYQRPAFPGDGLRAGGIGDERTVRGGGFNTIATRARASLRYGLDPKTRSGTIGVRPALGLPPP